MLDGENGPPAAPSIKRSAFGLTVNPVSDLLFAYRHNPLIWPDDWGIPDCPEAVHWRDDFATMVGAPGAYDYGPERASWMSHMLTNWIGDDGFLRKMKCAVRRHNPVGDILFFDGRVTRKFEENGRKLVEISVQALTDTGEESLNGSAVAELPTKS